MVFLTVLRIKATLKGIKNLDVRMAIGIGKREFTAFNITESNGEAFIHSGEKLESLKPDLAVFGSYASNSYNRDGATALKDVDDGKLLKSVIGVSFTMLLGTGAKGSFLDAAWSDAKAAEIRAQKELSTGKTTWREFLRRYQVAKQNVVVLQDVAKYQEARARAERDKFSKGRTVTANVITSETDAAEAAVNLLRARSSLRKLEASSVMYDILK